MDNERKELTVPYIAYESALDKADRQHKRMIVIIFALVVLLVLSNIVWIIAWNQYDYVDGYEIDVDSEGGGYANFIENNGDIDNGENKS